VAYSDPQSVIINAVSQSLPRTSTGVDRSVYTKDDQTVKLTVQQSAGRRKAHTLRLDFQKTAADPLISAQNIIYSMSVRMVVDRPLTGFTVAEAKQIVDAFAAYLTVSSGVNVTKLLGGEN
jgi:hypothetical protein